MAGLLLDTTYLLPVFGVGVSLKHYSALFSRLWKSTQYYTAQYRL